MTAPASEGVRLWRVVSTWSGNVSFHTDEATARQYGYHAPYVAFPLDGAERARAERDALEKENAAMATAALKASEDFALVASRLQAQRDEARALLKEARDQMLAVIDFSMWSGNALSPRATGVRDLVERIDRTLSPTIATALGDDGRGRG